MDDELKNEIISVGSVLLMMIMCIAALIVTGFTNNNNCDSLIMYDQSTMKQIQNTTKNGGVNGVYFHNNYYCVWTKGRSMIEIETTENHEICHHLIENDPCHFGYDYKATINECTNNNEVWK